MPLVFAGNGAPGGHGGHSPGSGGNGGHGVLSGGQSVPRFSSHQMLIASNLE